MSVLNFSVLIKSVTQKMSSGDDKKFDFSALTSLVGCTQIPGPITCMQAYKKRLFIGTGRGTIFLYEVVVKEDKIDSDKVYCKAELKEQKTTQSKNNSIISIQIDPIFKVRSLPPVVVCLKFLNVTVKNLKQIFYFSHSSRIPHVRCYALANTIFLEKKMHFCFPKRNN